MEDNVKSEAGQYKAMIYSIGIVALLVLVGYFFFGAELLKMGEPS